MSIFDDAISAALSSVRQVAGTTVTVTRGAQTGTAVTAAVGQTEYEIDDAGAVIDTWTSCDFLMLASDYAPTGTPSPPAKGDVINRTINGVPHQFAILNPHGKQGFEYSDRAQTTLRVHTKEIV